MPGPLPPIKPQPSLGRVGKSPNIGGSGKMPDIGGMAGGSSASSGSQGYVDEGEEMEDTDPGQPPNQGPGQESGQGEINLTDLSQVSGIITSVGLGLAVRYALAYTSFLIVPGFVFWLVKIGNDTSFKMKCNQLKEIANKLPLEQVPNPYVKAALFIINIGPDPIIMQLTAMSMMLMFVSCSLVFIVMAIMFTFDYCNSNRKECYGIFGWDGMEIYLKAMWNS